ncbi:variant leucine-rich repeat-containing protein [Bifidobacterium platyrrhinorum]|nr:hypothetical protein [Bifidobacterium platyrrhinorum]
MVDYDAAVAAVQDPNADPIFLAKIAYENPEFGANVAVNPRAYPGLLRWIAEFGDERARDTVAQMGYAVPDSPAGANQPSTAQSFQSFEPAARATDAQEAQPAQPAAAQTSNAESYAAGQPASYEEPAAQPIVNASDAYAASSYVQPAQNPYGFTAELARTTTDQMQMAEIAQKAPELYASLALNPNLYPALVDWLAQLGDPAVNAALATRQ